MLYAPPAQLILFQPEHPEHAEHSEPARTASSPPAEAVPGSSAAGEGPPSQPPRQRQPRHRPKSPPKPQRPGFGLCVLGSGSGGNCAVVRAGSTTILIDAGFGPRTTARRLAQANLTLDDLDAICLTHLDQDHFRRTWVSALFDLEVQLNLHRWHLGELLRLPKGPALCQSDKVQTFDDEPFNPLRASDRDESVSVQPLRVQHDRQASCAFRIRWTNPARGELGYVTDLGHAPPALVRHLAGVDLLCIEANYDPLMTSRSGRPAIVNRRNMSDSGHLSNAQAFEAVREVEALSPPGRPRHIVLLHRSSQCNHEMTVRRVFDRSPSISRRLTLTDQRRRTRWIKATAAPAVTRHQPMLSGLAAVLGPES